MLDLPFLTTWRTTNASESITIPLPAPAASYSLTIDWGDGQVETITTQYPISHNYSVAGLHNVSILGDIRGFGFGYAGDLFKIVDIASFGSRFVMDGGSLDVFGGCWNLRVSASPTDQPVFLRGATLEGMFADTEFNAALNWDLTNVVSLNRIFAGARQLNQPLIFYNTLDLIDTRAMFEGATSFNQQLTIDTRNVGAMEFMFHDAWAFNQPLNFVTDKVVFMMEMFSNAISFNQPVNFNTTLVQNMTNMFRNASNFNWPVAFDTNNVLDMTGMFQDAAMFNRSIVFGGRSLQTTDNMFKGASSFDQPVNLSTTTQLRSVSGMFAGVNSCFDQPVNFAVSANVTNMADMFLNVSGFHQNLSNWDTQAVVSCSNFCPECGLPAFPLCSSPCATVAPNLCNFRTICAVIPTQTPSAAPTRLPSLAPSTSLVDLCGLAQVSANLQVG